VSGIEGREIGIVAVMPVTRWWVDISFSETDHAVETDRRANREMVETAPTVAQYSGIFDRLVQLAQP
jgi:hypothetical protein